MSNEERSAAASEIGALGVIDLFRLPHQIYRAPPKEPVFVVCLMDERSRLAWAEILNSEEIPPIVTHKLVTTLHAAYSIRFTRILSDNSLAFRSPAFDATLERLG